MGTTLWRARSTAIISDFHGEWGFLSNFHPSGMTWEGIRYATAEHAFNAGKTLDPEQRLRIARVLTPGQAKKMGRSVQLRPGWENPVRYDVMWSVLWAKFTCHPGRIEALLSTGDAYLVEGNTWHDQHWGNCLCGRPACSRPGDNHLGQMLMHLRAILRERDPR
jgi:ribA/ribD-fused uncharacterized protein